MTDHDTLCPLAGTNPGPCGWCVRIAKVRADERERIARAIEAGCVHGLQRPTCYRCMYAARIARGDSDE